MTMDWTDRFLFLKTHNCSIIYAQTIQEITQNLY